jgi:TonB family protein
MREVYVSMRIIAVALAVVALLQPVTAQVELPSTSDRAVLDRARVLKKPVYPAEARNAGLVGTVVVRVIVSPDGEVVSARAVAGPEGLRAAAIKAVQSWEFSATDAPDTLAGLLLFRFASGEQYAAIVGVREQELAVAPDASPPTRAPEPAAPPVKATPPPPPAPVVQRIADLTSRAKRKVPPDYPSAARRARVEGLVVVELEVDEEGRVTSARAVSGNALLRDAAIAAARKWTFESEGKRAIGTIAFNFRM